MKKIEYPELLAEMARHGDTQKAIAKLLELSIPSFSRRLSGEVDWSISDIEKLCKHYNKDYYELFKK